MIFNQALPRGVTWKDPGWEPSEIVAWDQALVLTVTCHRVAKDAALAAGQRHLRSLKELLSLLSCASVKHLGTCEPYCVYQKNNTQWQDSRRSLAS